MTTRHILLPAAIAAVAFAGACVASCSHLSSEAREIVGNYYIPEISNDDPLFELRDDATCTIRAIWPGVLTYAVDGKWNVANDSLVALLDVTTLEWEGDSSLIGDVAQRYTRQIVDYDETSLTVRKDGVNYVYQRR